MLKNSSKRIYLNNNKIENIEPISNFSKLIFLELNNNKITNIESIIHLVNLIEIHVGFNDITRFNFSPKLRNMFIDMNQVDVFHQKSNNRVSSKKTKSIYKFYDLLCINIIDNEQFLNCKLVLKYASKNMHLNLNNDGKMVERFFNKCRNIDLEF